MITIFLHVLNLGLIVSLPIAVILLLRPLIKKAPAWIACLLWVVVAVRLICPFTFKSVFSLMPKTEPVAVLLPSTVPTATPIEDLPTAVVPVPTAVPEDPTGAPDAERTPVPQKTTDVPDVTPTRVPEDPASLKTPNTSAAPEKTEKPPVVPGTEEDPTEPKPILLPVLCGVWVAGMAGMALYALTSSLKIKRRVATATKLENRVKQSENVDSPFLLGLFRPTIYLPYTITDEDKAMVLAHEWAHVARHDHWWKPLGFLLLTVYWFQPLLWLSYFLLCRDIEAACDEKVVRPMDADARRAYSSALLRYGTRPRTMAVCPLAFGETNIKERVKKVMNFKKPALWIIVISLVLCVILSACFLTDPVQKGATPSPKPNESSPTPNESSPTPNESSPTPEPTPSPTPAESNPTSILLTEKGLITAQSDVPNYDADPVDAIRYQGTTKDRSGKSIIEFDNWLVNSNWFKDPRNAERVFPTVQFEEELSFTFPYAGVSIVPTPTGGVGFGGTRLYNERYEEIAVLTDLRWLDDLDMEFTYGELKTLSDGTYYLSIPVHYTCITPGNTQLVDDCNSFLIFCLIKTSTPTPTPKPTPRPTPVGRIMYTDFSCGFYLNTTSGVPADVLQGVMQVTAFETVQSYEKFIRVKLPDGRYGFIPEASLYDFEVTPSPNPTAMPAPTLAPASRTKINSRVEFGTYEQDNDLTNGAEPIGWEVLDVKDGKALLISNRALDIIPYNESDADVTWETCSLRAWLNDTFLKKAFTAAEQKQIVTTTISAATQMFEGRTYGNDTKDKVFILSSEEACSYDFYGFGTVTKYASSKGTKFPEKYSEQGFYWLRGPGVYQNWARNCNNRGGISYVGLPVNDKTTGVRPVIWVTLPPEPPTPTPGTPRPTMPPAQKAKVGDTVYLGTYEQDNDEYNGKEDIAWDILEVKDGKALVISHYVLDEHSYHVGAQGNLKETTWEKSMLRAWLNDTFLNSTFTKEEQARILTTSVSADRNSKYNTVDPGNDTKDQIFILSITEVEKYYPDDRSRRSAPTAYGKTKHLWTGHYFTAENEASTIWWLRSPGAFESSAAVVQKDGTVEYVGESKATWEGIRPVMWIRLD